MPAKEETGAQPAIENLKQAIHRKEWFNKNDCS